MAEAKRQSAEVAAGEDPIHRLLCGRVRDLRKKRGWTLDQLAAASGVSRSMLSQVERGEANPTPDLGVGDPCVRLERLENGEGRLVDHGPNVSIYRRIVNDSDYSQTIRLIHGRYAVDSTTAQTWL